MPVAAPGDGVVSTARDGGYETRSGTSMAAPHVAGVAALMASVAPTLSAQELRGLLLEHSVKPPTPGKPGYVDALGSVQAAMAAADLAARTEIGSQPTVRILGSQRRGKVTRAQIAKSADVRFVRVKLDGKVVSVLNGTRTPQTLILRNFKGRTLLAEGLGPNGGRIASATARVGTASPEPDTIALSGSSAAGAEVAEVLRDRPHATRFQLVGGGTEMGLADTARGIVDAGLVDRPLAPTDPAGLVFTPFAGSETLGFVTRGAPPEDLARVLRWIAASATPIATLIGAQWSRRPPSTRYWTSTVATTTSRPAATTPSGASRSARSATSRCSASSRSCSARRPGRSRARSRSAPGRATSA